MSTTRMEAAGLGIGTLQAADRAAIRAWVREHAGYLSGRVLDYGCGEQPYRALVSGDYAGYDPNYYEHGIKPDGLFDAILCTQAVQAMDDPAAEIAAMKKLLAPNGCLLLTYHPSWYEVESVDRWRFSRRGMECLLAAEILEHEPILSVHFADFSMHMTYGVVARAA